MIVRRPEKGFGIIEILIALALLSGLVWTISNFVTSAQTQTRQISSGASCSSAAQTVIDTFNSMGTRDNILPMVLDPNNLEARYRSLPAAIRFQSLLPTGTQVLSTPVLNGPTIYSSQLNLSAATYLEILNNSAVDYCSSAAPLPPQLVSAPAGMDIRLQILPISRDLAVFPCTRPLQTRPMGRTTGGTAVYPFMAGHPSVAGYRALVMITTREGKSCQSSADYLHASDLSIAEAGGAPLIPQVSVVDGTGAPPSEPGGAFCPAPAEIEARVQFDVSGVFPGVDFESGSIPVCRDPSGAAIWQPCSVASLLGTGAPVISVNPSEPSVMRMRFSGVPAGTRSFQVATVDMAGNLSPATPSITVEVLAACSPPPTTTTTSSTTSTTGAGPAPVDCVGSWGDCTVTCGGGTQIFSVTTPAANGGMACLFADGASRACNEHSCGCTSTTWEPDASTVCAPLSFTQTSDCGETRTSPLLGTKDCTTPCEPTTWTPAPNTVCSGTTFTQTSDCGTTRAETGTRTPIWSPAAPLPAASLICDGITQTRTNDCGESESVTGTMLPNFVPEVPRDTVCPNELVTQNDSNSCSPPQQVPGTKPSQYDPPLPNANTLCVGQSVNRTDTCGMNPVTIIGTMEPILPLGSLRPEDLCIGEFVTVTSTNGCGDVNIAGTKSCTWSPGVHHDSGVNGVCAPNQDDIDAFLAQSGQVCNRMGDMRFHPRTICPEETSMNWLIECR